MREIPRDWSICANRTEGYAVAYPSDWRTARECTFFDPKPIQAPENSDVFGFALQVSPAQESFDAVADAFASPPFFEHVKRDQLEVAGRRAARIEATSTGQGLYDKGLVMLAYVVDRGERSSLVLQTFKTPGSDWAERTRVLDRAADTLVLFRPDEDSTTVGAQPSLPGPVERKRASILEAARAHDYERLETLADPKQFEFTFGGGEDGPAAYWRRRERDSGQLPEGFVDPSPADALAAILEMPYTVLDVPGSLSSARKIYVWPFAYDVEPGALTADQKAILAPVMSEEEIESSKQFGSYFDWRAGITPDGRWIFFVSGD